MRFLGVHQLFLNAFAIARSPTLSLRGPIAPLTILDAMDGLTFEAYII
jgi:hypothetical protein